MNSIYVLFLDLNYLALLACISAFIMSTSFYLYPVIINVSKLKGLMDAPDNRKMHHSLTPTLGGLGVFIAFSLSIIFYGLIIDLNQTELIKLLGLLGSAIILVFLGVKDDLVSMSPKKKFLGQLLAVLNVVVLTDIRILGFEGLLGIGDLPYVLSVLFTVFVFILIINALNLIDGIDGLAGLISVISSIVFGILFYLQGQYLMTLISAILVGSIVGFLRYNLSSKQKIFMGDCGSMLSGFLLAYQGVSLIAINAKEVGSVAVSNTPILLLAILSYPLFDLLRVFTVRIKQGLSPFNADSNHIHHRLLRIGLDHKEATLILCILNIIVVGVSFWFNMLEIHLHLLITVIVGSLVYLAPFLKVFDKKINVDAAEIPKAVASNDLQTNTIEESGISLNSVVYSNRHNKGKAVKMNQDKVHIENESDKALRTTFSSIVSSRRKNLRQTRKNLTDKIPAEQQEIVDGDR